MTHLTVANQELIVNLIDGHVSLQSLHSCKLNIIAWVVESIYLHVVVKVWKFAGWPQWGRLYCKSTLLDTGLHILCIYEQAKLE